MVPPEPFATYMVEPATTTPVGVNGSGLQGPEPAEPKRQSVPPPGTLATAATREPVGASACTCPRVTFTAFSGTRRRLKLVTVESSATNNVFLAAASARGCAGSEMLDFGVSEIRRPAGSLR